MPMAQDWKILEPQDRLTISPSEPLMSFLNDNSDSPIRISMRNQKRPDSRVLQVLLTAARAWKARNLGFDVSDMPPRLVQDFVRLGLTAENTGWSGLK
ncbi:STAS domain-containing protein [bacterium]|nr:STAS domain-containing protein [bacterium]